jgi:hypothetical protein
MRTQAHTVLLLTPHSCWITETGKVLLDDLKLKIGSVTFISLRNLPSCTALLFAFYWFHE